MKNYIAKLLMGSLALLLAACATGKNSLKIDQINALSSMNDNDGSFRGLEFLADPIPGTNKKRVNVFYLHGIGWTEDPQKEQLGNNFLSAIARAYGLNSGKTKLINSACGSRPSAAAEAQKNHIYINPRYKQQYYQTMIPGAKLKLDKLVCIDRQTLEIDPTLEFVVYRIFWDNIFWDQIQRPHVGQDDTRDTPDGITSMRAKYNRRMKDELVNYGISDAVMYLGSAGSEIRNAVRGAMCSAALDAGGYSFARQGHSVDYDQICATASNTSVQTNQFAFVSESLGSKITFDVMREAMTDGSENVLDDIMAGSEFFMLANQLALLSLSDLSQSHPGVAYYDPAKTRPKIIALSEINDLLTYEINPFLEQLWTSQATEDGRRPRFDQTARQRIIEGLGFDVVDIRLEFADKLVPMFDDFIDPLQAHSGHALEPELMTFILCGAENGKVKREGCVATGGK